MVGGTNRYSSANIEFLRFDKNGNIKKKLVISRNFKEYNFKDNPILLNGDVINIRRNVLGETFDGLTEIVKYLSIYKAFD
tara:strand:- start:5632 stop:5871 length:240 start_codon:yes stop_codon:yes gene_type:complete